MVGNNPKWLFVAYACLLGLSVLPQKRVVAIKHSTLKVILYKVSYILVLNLVTHLICRVFLENIHSSSSICNFNHGLHS